MKFIEHLAWRTWMAMLLLTPTIGTASILKTAQLTEGIKVLLHHIGNPTRLTAMVCWTTG